MGLASPCSVAASPPLPNFQRADELMTSLAEVRAHICGRGWPAKVYKRKVGLAKNHHSLIVCTAANNQQRPSRYIALQPKLNILTIP